MHIYVIYMHTHMMYFEHTTKLGITNAGKCIWRLILMICINGKKYLLYFCFILDFCFLFWFCSTVSYYVAQAILKLVILLP